MAQSEHTRAVEDLFEPAGQPICSLGLGAPKRLKHAEHERRIDSFNRQLPDDGVDELADCVLPRGQAPGAAPSRLAGLNIVLRGCSKVVALAAATLASWAGCRFSAKGSRPSRNCSRRAVALRRAFSSVTCRGSLIRFRVADHLFVSETPMIALCHSGRPRGKGRRRPHGGRDQGPQGERFQLGRDKGVSWNSDRGGMPRESGRGIRQMSGKTCFISDG